MWAVEMYLEGGNILSAVSVGAFQIPGEKVGGGGPWPPL